MDFKVSNSKYVVVGGAGFIGSHFVEALLGSHQVEAVTVIDNFSSGTRAHLKNVMDDPRLKVVEFDLAVDNNLAEFIPPKATVIHLASNPDIALAATEPTIDFVQGTALTNAVVEATRVAGGARILYASGSGVYGDYGEDVLGETGVDLLPVSTYGASKLAGEAILCSYAHMFGVRALAFRFGNVIGAKQTHGVGYDFVRRLKADPSSLRILGDGNQSKTYVHVNDVVRAVLLAESVDESVFSSYNVGTDEYITVTQIGRLALDVLGLPADTPFEYTGGDRGWKGDVPILRLDTQKIRGIGWANEYSTAEAMRLSLAAMLEEIS
jgi:UDP-glucose 4-epimerase